MRIKKIALLCIFLFLPLMSSAKSSQETSLTPYLANKVSFKNYKKVSKIKKKASKAKKWANKFNYYLQAAKLGDYDSQVNIGYYYGFGTFYPNHVQLNEDNKPKGAYFSITNEPVARYFLNAAKKNKNAQNIDKVTATLGLIYLSLDSIDYPEVAHKVYADLILDCACELGAFLEKNPTANLSFSNRHFMYTQTGRLLSTMLMKGIGTERDLLYAHYCSLWTTNQINMPNTSIENKYSDQIMKLINSLQYDEESKKYGVGLVAALLLKRAADLYAKNKSNPEIIFWVERSLEADSTFSKAYYLAGCLYMNGEAGLVKSRNRSKKWFAKGSKFGSEESAKALIKIREIEKAERYEELRKEKERREEKERKRQRRRQIWAQAIGTIVQVAGNAYMYSHGNTNTNNLLNPNLALAQAHYSQMAAMQQVSMQNIQMPQFNVNWSVVPQFTIDWSKIDWNSVPIDTYYQYQGDLLNNGVGTSQIGGSDNLSYTNTGSTNEQTCHLCHGIGKCWTCNGNRQYINPLTGKNVTCPNCTDGLCSHCHGSGKK